MDKKERKNKKPAVNAVELLMKDHEIVRDLLNKLEKATEKSGRRQQLFEKIKQELKIHTQIEEEIFYPAYIDAVKKKDDRKLYFEAIEEHHVVDMVIPEIAQTDPTTEMFAAKAKVLKDIVEHHAEEEEIEMFPVALEVMSDEELEELGARLQERKDELKKEMAKINI